MTARDRLILAPDLPSWETAEGIVKRLEGKIHLFKVGLELFTANLEGCARCSRGYRGRFAVLETLPMSYPLKRMVIEGKSVEDMKEKALEEGMVSLRRVGILNAIRGVTSVEEVLRITLND